VGLAGDLYRGLVEDGSKATEEDFAFQFEAPHKFLKAPLAKAYGERERRAALVRAADDALSDVVQKVKKRGLNHPYVKNYVLARTTPLSRARKTLPSFEQTFERLRENLEAFDPAKVRLDEIARAAVFAAPA
jgi:hypothetical protein